MRSERRTRNTPKPRNEPKYILRDYELESKSCGDKRGVI